MSPGVAGEVPRTAVPYQMSPASPAGGPSGSGRRRVRRRDRRRLGRRRRHCRGVAGHDTGRQRVVVGLGVGALPVLDQAPTRCRLPDRGCRSARGCSPWPRRRPRVAGSASSRCRRTGRGRASRRRGSRPPTGWRRPARRRGGRRPGRGRRRGRRWSGPRSTSRPSRAFTSPSIDPVNSLTAIDWMPVHDLRAGVAAGLDVDRVWEHTGGRDDGNRHASPSAPPGCRG